METFYSMIMLYTLTFVPINGQFNNFMSQMMSSGTGSKACTGASISCLPAPWCRRSTDERGCTKCDCNLGNTMGKTNFSSNTRNNDTAKQMTSPQVFSPFMSILSGAHGPGGGAGLPSMSQSGLHPGFGGSQMGPMNPMASMFGANSMYGGGPSGSMSAVGGIPNGPQGSNSQQTGNGCGPVPYTCMVPPPWCQRLPDSNGCVKCYCGQELAHFLQIISGVTDEPDVTSHESNSDYNGSTLSAILKTTQTIQTTTARPPLGKPCLANFQCTLSCDTGFQTDDNECPVCACMDDSSTVTDDTDQTTLGQTIQGQSSTTSQDGGMILCPGIFDCDTVCVTGYKTDASGCPICQCESN